MMIHAKNGWTGGQYSLFRFLFGLYLVTHFIHLLPWAPELYSNQGVLPVASSSPLAHLFPNILAIYDAAWFVTALMGAAAMLATMFAVGWCDRFAAIALWYLWACFFGRNPLTSNPSLPYIGMLLLCHALIPPAPYGSLSARMRVDPIGGWFMPSSVWAVAWVLMAAGYTYSGYAKLSSPSWIDGSAVQRVLENPLARPTFIREALLAFPQMLLRLMTWTALGLELAFAPLAIFRVVRPWIWLAALGMHLTLMILIDFADLSLGMVMLHLFTFNPLWIAPSRNTSGATVFFDGHCGLCHGTVRFLLSEDRLAAFRYAPLGGDTFTASFSAPQRQDLPDSIVVLTADGHALIRSAGVLFLLRGLGGAWRLIAVAGGLIPRPIRDVAYDMVAKSRRKLFTAPNNACPILPPQLRSRIIS